MVVNVETNLIGCSNYECKTNSPNFERPKIHNSSAMNCYGLLANLCKQFRTSPTKNWGTIGPKTIGLVKIYNCISTIKNLTYIFLAIIGF